jgi:surfeit locus 1 family protein
MFKPGWKMTLFTLAFVPLLFWLGLWQLEREQEKAQLQQDYELRTLAPAMPLETIDWQREDLAFLKVRAKGRFDNQRVYLLDNKVHEGQVGYELINPFETEAGQIVLVNRGWVAQGASRSELPSISAIEGLVEIQGSIYVPLDDVFLLNAIEESAVTEGPKVIQSIQIETLTTDLAKKLAPYTVRLIDNSTGLEQANWQAVNMLPEKHRAYAVQWFTMLFALIVMYIYFGFKSPRLNRDIETL